MEGSLIVAVVAVIISGLSLAGSGVALWFARRADRRAEEQEERDLTRFKRELVADLDARCVNIDYDESRGYNYRFAVTNHGEGLARDVEVGLVEASGRRVAWTREPSAVKSGASWEVSVLLGSSAKGLYPVVTWSDSVRKRAHWKSKSPLPQ